MFKKALLATAAVAAVLSGSVAAQAQDVFRIGILGGENEADRLRNNQCMVDLLPAAIGVKEVKLFPAADYAGVIQGLLGGTLDYAELGASAYASVYLTDSEAVDPVLTTVQTDGATGYYSIMLARKESGITNIEEAKGKKLGFADPDSTSGFLVPSVALPAQLGMEIEDYFSGTGFGGGHENGVLEMLKGNFDVQVTWSSGVGEFEDGYTSGNIRKMVDKGLLDMDDVNEVWRSPLIPNGPIVVSNKLDQDVRAKFVEFMKAMPEANPDCFRSVQGGDFAGFTDVDHSFYETIVAARKAKIGS
ncbi:MAG: phosphonate ABC transporter substrate-binding protein [Pseudomonadota bacterium]